MAQHNNWQKFSENLLRYSDPDLWLDLSLMDLPDDLISSKEKIIIQSLDEITRIEQGVKVNSDEDKDSGCLLYTSPSPRDGLLSRMPSSA